VQLTFLVKEVDAAAKLVEVAEVHEDAGGVVLDVARVLGAVVRVVPATDTPAVQ